VGKQRKKALQRRIGAENFGKKKKRKTGSELPLTKGKIIGPQKMDHHVPFKTPKSARSHCDSGKGLRELGQKTILLKALK